MTDLFVLPDLERVLSAFLRAQPEIADVYEGRVYTSIPANPTWPLLRLTRIGGVPLLSNLLWVDRAMLQLDSWGGPKAQAHDGIEVVRAVMDARFLGHQDDAVINNVSFGEMRYEPDAEYTPARPRYLTTVDVTFHAASQLPVS